MVYKTCSSFRRRLAKEPHRNKLNLLMNRTNHLSYHLGQLVLLQQQCEFNVQMCEFSCAVRFKEPHIP
jgi:hypothetical protein